MKWLALLTFIILPQLSFAQAEHQERLQLMVKSGAITEEAAREEWHLVQDKRHQQLEARSQAQRSLASVNPSLKPLKIVRMKAKPMILFFE